jgi:hypothetical protein
MKYPTVKMINLDTMHQWELLLSRNDPKRVINARTLRSSIDTSPVNAGRGLKSFSPDQQVNAAFFPHSFPASGIYALRIRTPLKHYSNLMWRCHVVVTFCQCSLIAFMFAMLIFVALLLNNVRRICNAFRSLWSCLRSLGIFSPVRTPITPTGLFPWSPCRIPNPAGRNNV